MRPDQGYWRGEAQWNPGAGTGRICSLALYLVDYQSVVSGTHT